MEVRILSGPESSRAFVSRERVAPGGLMIGHIVTRTRTSFEPALRSDGVENRLLHLELGDPRGVAPRRAQHERFEPAAHVVSN